MNTKSEEKSLTFASKEPNVMVLQKACDDTLADLEGYFQQCRQSYDDRNNIWPGKSRDLRKHGADAFPWEGASDSEAHVIDSRINSYVALLISSMVRANIRAYPVEFGDMSRARVISSFLKWMVSSYIPRFKKEMEASANHLLERGMAITYVGWQREDRTYLQRLDLQQLAQVDPALAESVMDGSADDDLIDMLRSVYPSVTDSRAKKALKELRKVGVAEIPVSRRQVDCPLVQSLTPDGDFFFPSYTTDPQRAPYCFWRTYFTPQELKNKVATEDWDADWVDYVIDKYRGINVDDIGSGNAHRSSSSWDDMGCSSDELIEVIYGYQRLIDPVDNSEGIYCTVFHRELSSKIQEVKPYAKFELLNGYEDYPIVVTRISEASKRLYDVQSMADVLRGIQWQVKVERDSRIDRNSMATMPPIMHPIGNAPSDWGPGRFVPYRRGGEFQFGPQPQYNPGSMEMEQTLLKVADELVGLGQSDPAASIKRQFVLDKFLMHVQEVIKMSFKCYQRFGPDQVLFRVTGVVDPMQFDKGNPDEDYDIVIGYDVLNSDPETQESKLNQLVSLMQLDRNGRINPDALIDIAANAIDPIAADSILQPIEEAQQQIVKFVTDDLTKIFAGIEMPARPNGAQIALQIIQEYAQQPDVAERLQSDEVFAGRIQKYAAQYTFQQQQAENAQIGRVGTAPASMGSVNTQSVDY